MTENMPLPPAIEALIEVAAHAAADLHSVAETMPDSQLRDERRHRVKRIFDSIFAVRREAERGWADDFVAQVEAYKAQHGGSI